MAGENVRVDRGELAWWTDDGGWRGEVLGGVFDVGRGGWGEVGGTCMCWLATHVGGLLARVCLRQLHACVCGCVSVSVCVCIRVGEG